MPRIKITNPFALPLHHGKDLEGAEVKTVAIGPHRALGWGSYFVSRNAKFGELRYLVSGKEIIRTLKSKHNGSNLLAFLEFLVSSGITYSFVFSRRDVLLLSEARSRRYVGTSKRRHQNG